MQYAKLLEDTLSVTDNGTTYTKKIYKQYTSITGVADESYSNYDSTATYNTNNYVIVPSLKAIYKCAADGVSGVFPPSDELKWIFWGFVNSYNMLSSDNQVGAKTIGTDVVIETSFNMLDVIALVDCNFDTVLVEQIDSNNNAIKSYNVSGREIGTYSFADYFYEYASYKTTVIFTDLEWQTASTVRLTFTGDVSIGNFVMGKTRDLGATIYGISMSVKDNSKIKTDEFTGKRDVLRYGHLKELNCEVVYDNNSFNLTIQKVLEIVGKNVLFIPTELDNYGEMNNIAYIEDFSAPIDNPAIIKSSLTIIGVN